MNFLKAARIAREIQAMLLAHANLDGLRRFAQLFALAGLTREADAAAALADSRPNAEARGPLLRYVAAFAATAGELLPVGPPPAGEPGDEAEAGYASWLGDFADAMGRRHGETPPPTAGSADEATRDAPLVELCRAAAAQLAGGPGGEEATRAPASAAEGDPQPRRTPPFGTF